MAHRVLVSDVKAIHRTVTMCLMAYRMAVSKQLSIPKKVNNPDIEPWLAHAENADKVLQLSLELLAGTDDEDNDSLKLLHRTLTTLQRDLSDATLSTIEG